MVFRPVFLGVGDGVLAERAYVMGDSSGANFREKPVQVSVGGSFVKENGKRKDWLFYLGKYEVTRAQYQAVGAQTGKRERTPQTGLTRGEVERFIETYNTWLRKEAPGALPEQGGSPGFLRLPSEEEWEFAARGGVAVNAERFQKATPYEGELAKHEWFGGQRSSFGKLKEVGLLAPNPLQIYDLLGNAAEMTRSPYTLEFGRGRIGGFTVRGGSFRTAEGDMRASLRTEQLVMGADGQSPRDESVGFRLAIGSAVFANLASSRALEDAAAVPQAVKTPAVPMETPAQPTPVAKPQEVPSAIEQQLRALQEEVNKLKSAKAETEKQAKAKLEKAKLAASAVTLPIATKNTLIVAERFSKVRECLRKAFPDESHQAALLCVEARSKVGDLKGLRGDLVDDDRGGPNMVTVLKAQAETGSVETALQTAKNVGDKRLKDEALSVLAVVQAHKGNLEGALRTTESLADNGIKVGTLTEISVIQAQTGNQDGALETLRRANAIVDKEASHEARASLLADVAIAYAKIGKSNEAERCYAEASKLLGTSDEMIYFNEMWKLIALKHIKSGDFGKAYSAMSKFQNHTVSIKIEVARGWQRIAETLIEERRLDLATRIVSDYIPPHVMQDENWGDEADIAVLIKIATAHANSGDQKGFVSAIEKAVASARTCSDTSKIERWPAYFSPRINALAYIARACARAGDHSRFEVIIAEASTVLERIADDNIRPYALEAIARAEADAGYIDRAKTTMKRIAQKGIPQGAEDPRAAVGEAIIGRLAEDGRFEEAQAMISQLSEVEAQRHCYRLLIRGLLLDESPAHVPRDTIPVPAPPRDPMAAATKDTPFVNSLGMKFVPVPITGGPTDRKRVLFSVWDTRVQDYAALVAENPSVNKKWKDTGFKGEKQGPTHPVVNVSWEEAKAFCEWLTKKERAAGNLGPEEEYRLPTDHEWSCAVGIGEREDANTSPSEKNSVIPDVYPWRGAWPPPKGAGNYVSDLRVDDYKFTSPVGSFAANSHGVYDIGGNVWQWCEDWYDGEHNYRAVRGASWFTSVPAYLLASYRACRAPTDRLGYFGFRCVLAPVADARR